MAENMTNQEQESPLDKNLRKFKTHLSTYPNKQLASLLRGYLVPILEEMRFEYSDAFSYLEERMDDENSSTVSEVLDESRETVVFLAALLDNVLARVGWLENAQVSEKFPEDLRAAFEEAKERALSLLQNIEAAQSAVDDDDGDDDGDDDVDDDGDDDGEVLSASESASGESVDTVDPAVLATANADANVNANATAGAV